MFLDIKSPDPGKEKFKTVVIYGKNLKIVFNCFKIRQICVFPWAGLCVYVVLLCYQVYWCLSFPEAEVALIEKVNDDVGTLPLWDFQFMLANMNWMSSASVNSSVSLATLKGEKMLGMPLQTQGCSTSACTPARERFRVRLPSLFLMNRGTGLDISASFFMHR